jgi:putative transposase
VQWCIVHLVRNALSYVSYKDRRAVAADLKTVYSATTATDAEAALIDFAATWDERYPTISKSWMAHWERIIPFFAFPADIRKAIYTTNAIESLNMTLRKVLRNHRSFPTDESALPEGDISSDCQCLEKMDHAHSRLEKCARSFRH